MSLSALTAEERETTVTTTDAAPEVRIWTNRARHIGQLKRHPAFALVDEGKHGTTAWAEFSIADDRWSPATGAKRKSNMSEEQRRLQGERMRKIAIRRIEAERSAL